MNIREIISNIIRGVVRANSAAEKSAHRRHRNPKLENSSVRYLNIRKLDLHVPPGLASIEQEWSVDREVTVNIIPDASLKAQNRPIRSSPRATSKSRSKLEFHKFLGSVFASLVQAEEMAARATVKLLSEMAVDDKKGDRRTDSSHNYHLGRIRTVTFEYLGVDFEGKTVKKELQIPLLSLITVPVLQIRDAKLDFEIEIFHDNRSTLRTKQGDIEPKELPLSDMPSEKFPLEESIPRLMITVPANRSKKDESIQESGNPTVMNDLPDEGLPSDFDEGEDFSYQSFRMGVSITVERSAMPQGVRDLLNMTDRQIILNTTSVKENGTSSKSMN